MNSNFLYLLLRFCRRRCHPSITASLGAPFSPSVVPSLSSKASSPSPSQAMPPSSRYPTLSPNIIIIKIVLQRNTSRCSDPDVMLHDLDAANAQPQGGQELIDECKQWICWLRSIGTESIDEWCSSTSMPKDEAQLYTAN
ncbi:uncharacterized protein DS421_11g334760 [Arachis hypogaea]|nr:uncharacterized protein DS421_11g334760 [Arachis hypogaea]